MKTPTKKSLYLDLVSKHDDVLKWFSRIENWKQGHQFMKVSLLRYSESFSTDEKAIALWTFNEELEQNIKIEMDWLEQKVHGHQLKIRSLFEVCPPAELSELNVQHQTLQAHIERFSSNYKETRMAFFDFLKPVLKQRISQRGKHIAA